MKAISQLEVEGGLAETTSVTFVPATTTRPGTEGRSVRHGAEWLVARMVNELELPLRALVRRLCHPQRSDGGTMVLLSGCQRGVGCTSVTLALATVAARDCRVVVIDGDLVTRGLTAGFDPTPAAGWDDDA